MRRDINNLGGAVAEVENFARGNAGVGIFDAVDIGGIADDLGAVFFPRKTLCQKNKGVCHGNRW